MTKPKLTRRGRKTGSDGARWVKRTYRVRPESRDQIVEIARELGVHMDAAARLAVRLYAEHHGHPLPGWLPLEKAQTIGFRATTDDTHPRLWVRMTDEWMTHMPRLFRGEVNTIASVVREAILLMHEQGKAAWHAAAATASEHEKQRANQDLLKVLSDVAAHELHRKEVTAQLNRQKTTLAARQSELVTLLSTGFDYRDVHVERFADFEAGVIRFIRVDTGEEVDVQRMSQAEREQAGQEDLFGGDGAAAGDAPPPRDEDAPPPDDDGEVPGDPYAAGPSLDGAPRGALPEYPDDAVGVGGSGPHDPSNPLEPGDDEADPDDDAAKDSGGGEQSLVGAQVEYLRKVSRKAGEQYLSGMDPDEIDNIHKAVTGARPAPRSRKATRIKAILDALVAQGGDDGTAVPADEAG